MPRGRRIRLILATLAIAASLGVLLYFAQPGVDRLEYVVPDGYTGPVIIRQAADGKTLEYDANERTHIIRLDESGELSVRDASPLRLWHTMHVRYENGSTILVRKLASQDEDEFGWWEGYTAAENEFVAYIGKLEDAKAFYERRR